MGWPLRIVLFLLSGSEDCINFTINGNCYNYGYYLADGIYPNWPVFVKSPHHPQDPAGKLLARLQEGARKDIERAFGVLQACFGILKTGAHFWHKSDVEKVMNSCIILHNMIVEDQSPQDPFLSTQASNTQAQIISSVQDPQIFNTLSARLQQENHLRSAQKHKQLMNDLKVHNCLKVGSQDES